MQTQIRTIFRQLTTKYDDHDTPTPDGIPLEDLSADRLRGGRAEIPPVVTKWRNLEEFDPNSRKHIDLLTSLFDDQLDRKATTSLRGEDAATVLDILARILDRGRNLGRLSNRTLGVLRSLAFNACQVPNNYKVDQNLVYDVDPVDFASGGFSDVRKGNLGGQVVAVKILRMAKTSNVLELQKHFCKETVLWKNISHPNILGLIAVDIDGRTGKCSMICELMENGNIFNFIQSNSANRLRLLADAAEGLHYLHEHKIIHGDIKGSNILITNGALPRACLCDFGFSTLAPTASFVMSTRGMNPFGGTTLYMAPELIHPLKFGLECSLLSKEGDIYAIGMVVYEVVTGVRPFGLENFWGQQMVCAVLDGMRPTKPENAEAIGFGLGVWSLVEMCWREDWKQRPKTGDVRQRLTVAASWSSSVPPGPTIALPPVPDLSTHIDLFSTSYEPTGPDRRFREEGGRDDREDARSILERSISVARLVVDGINASIPPTIRERFGILDRLPLRRFINDFRARFNLEPTRPHQD